MKYRIPRKQKKAEKRKLIADTDRDMIAAYGRTLTKREVKSLKYEVWIMAGVVYHKYNFTK